MAEELTNTRGSIMLYIKVNERYLETTSIYYIVRATASMIKQTTMLLYQLHGSNVSVPKLEYTSLTLTYYSMFYPIRRIPIVVFSAFKTFTTG
jgi:hypothetical protein